MYCLDKFGTPVRKGDLIIVAKNIAVKGKMQSMLVFSLVYDQDIKVAEDNLGLRCYEYITVLNNDRIKSGPNWRANLISGKAIFKKSYYQVKLDYYSEYEDIKRCKNIMVLIKNYEDRKSAAEINANTGKRQI